MKYFLIFFFLIFFNKVYSQNLVPNPSFEDSVNCPILIVAGELNYTYGWYSSLESPDYLHSCSSNPNFSVPSNSRGYQLPYHGNAYIDLLTYAVGFSNLREVASIELTQSLIVGQTYYISMYASLVEAQALHGATSKLGIKFSTVEYSTLNTIPINNISHVYTSTIISDSISWMPISGTFIADSAYKYINIGNFFDDFNTDTLNLDNRSVYFIDYVCVASDSNDCIIGNGITDNNSQDTEILLNNISENYIKINFDEPFNVIVYDLAGKFISTEYVDDNIINISRYANGFYIIRIITSKNLYTSKFLKK